MKKARAKQDEESQKKRRESIELSLKILKSLKFASEKHVDHVIETKKYGFSIYTHKLRRK